MVLALICSHTDLDAELAPTLLHRAGMDRQVAATPDQARAMAAADRPDIVVVDRDLPDVKALVSSLRKDPRTRTLSILIAARGDFEASEVELLMAGANSILRLPATAEWDDRLLRLIDVPVRKEARFAVTLAVETTGAFGSTPSGGQALNLSESGMLIEADVPLGLGDDLELSFQLSEDGAPVRVHGRVRRIAAGTRFGIEFLRFEGDGAETIRAFVEKAAPA